MATLDQAPVCAAAGREQLLANFSRPTLVNRMVAVIRAWSGRRAVMHLRDFDDAQLADIGLQRSDIQTALGLPLSADPSHHLIGARQNPLRGTKRF